MKTKKLLSIMLFLFLIMGTGGCGEKDLNPEEKILGKWELIERNWLLTEPLDELVEFLANGKIRFLFVNGEYSENTSYQINSDYFYCNSIENEEEKAIFKYTFYEDNLKLELIESTFMTPELYAWTISIYKKKKL